MNNPEDIAGGIVEMRANYLKLNEHTIILSSLDAGAMISAMQQACIYLPDEAQILPVLRNLLVRISVVNEAFGPPPRKGAF